MYQTGRAEAAVAALTPDQAALLVARIAAIPLFAHAYAWHLNFRLGQARPIDLLHFAHQHQLVGVKIHVEDGEARSLLHDPASHPEFAACARDLRLAVHIETSSTQAADLAAAIRVAHATGASSVRFYPRHSGPLSQVMAATIADLKRLPELNPDGGLDYLLEQHEDLKGTELVQILHATANPRLSLLFDFANMINAGETPQTALDAMAPYTTDVHIKDAQILPDRGGYAHRACRSGEGDIDFAVLLARLLLLGNDAPQVRAFALEEENEMFAPAYRFAGEGPDPVIPARDASTTHLTPGESLPDRLAREQHEATAQIRYVRALLWDLSDAARIHAQGNTR